MKKCPLLMVATLALFLSASSITSASKPSAPQGKSAQVQWEHLAFTHDLKSAQTNADVAREIVRLGKEGWELVSVANFTESGTTTRTTYYFKRRL
jgi:hypothetical protein